MTSQQHLDRMAKWDKHCVDCGTLIAIQSIRCNACRGKAHSGENNPVFGKPAWNRGREHPPETRARISQALTGKPLSPEHRALISTTQKGRIISQESRAKNSKSHTGMKFSDEHRKNIGLIRKGKTYEEMYGPEKALQLYNVQKKRGLECKEKFLQNVNTPDAIARRIQTLKETLSDPTNHPRWLGGKSFEPYGLDFNTKFREAIRERDNRCCMVCNKPEEDFDVRLSIHHIDYKKINNFPQNCISLCRTCHMNTNIHREVWTKHFQELLKRLYGYEYTQDQKIVLDYTNTED